MNSDVSGIILAGGKSSRFQQGNKALAKINDEFFIESIINVLTGFVSEIFISCGTQERQMELEHIIAIQESKLQVPIRFVLDRNDINLMGPLNGYFSALQNVTTTYTLVIPVDMPLINQGIIDGLYQHITTGDYNLISFYDGAENIPLLFHICNTHRMKDVLAELNVYEINRVSSLFRLLQAVHLLVVSEETSKTILTNINTVADLDNLEKLDSLKTSEVTDQILITGGIDYDSRPDIYRQYCLSINTEKKIDLLQEELISCNVPIMSSHIKQDLELLKS